LTADDLDMTKMPTEEDADPGAVEKEEEQSGLILLLQQMSLTELREIVRQRGWRVNGTSKADYASALACLLCDPTETARAVTEMPEDLREALRAAFVADDGSGITATTMARTVTALRSASATHYQDSPVVTHRSHDTVHLAGATTPGGGVPVSRSNGTRRPRFEHVAGERPPGPAIKPVEAAALLIDLARWGLVLPWRDSLYGQGRHVLPWHMQRLLPPLPGCCGLTAPVPLNQTQVRDARQFVDSLYAVWESIAVVQPALRPQVPRERDAVRPCSDRPPRQAEVTPRAGPKAPDAEGTALAPTRDALAAKRLAERRLQSLVQGWPYDPEELQGWIGTRRRAETTALTLSVPPPPLLVEDAALPILARSSQATGFALGEASGHSLAAGDGHSLAAGDGEELDFMCRLLCELGLVSIQNDHLVAQREQMACFLQHSLADQHRAAAQAYLSLLDWSELDSLLRRDRRLTLWHKPYFAIPYDQFRSWLVRLRHLLLRFLASAGEEGWCRLADIDEALRELWPCFPSALQSERESWLVQAWGLTAHREVRGPDMAEPPAPGEVQVDSQYRLSQDPGRGNGPPAECHHPGEAIPADWQESQGALLRVMLEGPLFWLGFAELSYGDGLAHGNSSSHPTGSAAPTEQGAGQLTAFRLRGLADWIWDRPIAQLDLEARPLAKALTIDEDAGTISLQRGSAAAQTHSFLGRIARLEEASPERFLYRLDRRPTLAAFESGASLSDLLAEWERVMPRAIPSALEQTLSEWWTQYGKVRLYDGFGLLELRDEVTLRELEAATSLSQHIIARLSPRLVLVREEAVDNLLREFAAKDYTPKEVD
jgi:hypothetical protein